MDADMREGRPRSHRRPVPRPGAAAPAAPEDAAVAHDATQLQLLDDQHLPDWRLDESTKAIGLHGVERARAALRTARRRQAELQDELQAESHHDDRDGRATAA